MLAKYLQKCWKKKTLPNDGEDQTHLAYNIELYMQTYFGSFGTALTINTLCRQPDEGGIVDTSECIVFNTYV